MKFIKKIENKLKKIYNPKEAPWKRKFLFIISIFIFMLLLIVSYYQLNYPFTNNGIWFLIGVFFILSSIGLLVSIFGSDFWVALILGNVF